MISLCRQAAVTFVSAAAAVQVMEFLGSAAFSKAVQAVDLKTNQLVCLKIVNNNKDYFDQSLDEIKLLQYINEADPEDEHNLLRLYDYFYYKVSRDRLQLAASRISMMSRLCKHDAAGCSEHLLSGPILCLGSSCSR